MASIQMIAEDDATGTVRGVYQNIRATLGIDFVPNIYGVMAANPAFVEAKWATSSRLRVERFPTGLVGSRQSPRFSSAICMDSSKCSFSYPKDPAIPQQPASMTATESSGIHLRTSSTDCITPNAF